MIFQAPQVSPNIFLRQAMFRVSGPGSVTSGHTKTVLTPCLMNQWSIRRWPAIPDVMAVSMDQIQNLGPMEGMQRMERRAC